MAVNNPWTWGLGRRKTAIARVRLKPGAGGFVVNGKPIDDYFVTTQTRQRARQALASTESLALAPSTATMCAGAAPSRLLQHATLERAGARGGIKRSEGRGDLTLGDCRC